MTVHQVPVRMAVHVWTVRTGTCVDVLLGTRETTVKYLCVSITRNIHIISRKVIVLLYVSDGVLLWEDEYTILIIYNNAVLVKRDLSFTYVYSTIPLKKKKHIKIEH